MTKERNNPWAGLASYEDPAKSERKLKFCGRDNDIYDVTRLIDDNLLLILYGKSGIGKTSLLNAGVFPELRKEQYLPVSIRLGTLEVSASYQEAIVYAIEKAIEEAHGSITVYHVVEEQTDNHHPDLLWNYFARHRFANAEGQPLFPVVVLDQFEEVLRNTSPEHVEKAQTLLNQLQYLIDESHALNDCVVDGQDYFYDFNFRFIISIREDELYLLEDNIDDLSLSMFRNCRYRLRSLSEQGATEAILLPGKDCIVEEQKQAVVDRVIELSKRPQSNDIDTLLLSLVCASTYDKKAGERITNADLAIWKSNPMEVYYQDAVKGLPADHVRYIQQHLIREDGSRRRVDAEEVKTTLGEATYHQLTQGKNRLFSIGDKGQVELLHDQLGMAVWEERKAFEERERKRKLRRRVTAIGLVILAISGIFVFQNQKLKQQQTQLQQQQTDLEESQWNMMENQSRAVAEKASKLADDGDFCTASMLALAVLPENLQSPNRPFCVEAESALRYATSHDGIVLKGHIDEVNTAFFSPDGTMIVSASDDGTIRVWDSKDGVELIKLDAVAGFVCSASFSPNGEQIVAGYKDCNVRIWDVKTKTIIKTLKGHTGNILSCSFSHNGKYIISSAEGDNTIRLWDANSGEIIRIIKGYDDCHNSVAFSPDDKYVVSAGGLDNYIRLWDLSSGKEVKKFASNSIYAVSYSYDGKYIVASSCESNDSQIWDIQSGRKLLSLKGHTGYVEYSSFSPNDKYIVSASSDDKIIIWDVKKGKQIKVLSGHTDVVNSVSYNSDGNRLISASSDKTIRVWGLDENMEATFVIGTHDCISCAVISPNEDMMVSSSRIDGTLQVWDLESGNEIRKLKGHTRGVFTVGFSPDGQYILSASMDNTIRLWDVKNGAMLQSYNCGNHLTGVASFSPDGKIIAFGDGTVLKILDVKSGKILKELCARKDNVISNLFENISSIAFSPNGKYVATATYNDKTIRVWNLETDSVVRVFNGHRRAVTSIAFSPDGNRLVSGACDRTVHVWGMKEDNCEILKIDGNSDFYSVAYSPDGKYISAGGWPDLYVWDAETGVNVQSFNGHTSMLNSVAFSLNGENIVSSSEDGTVRIWTFPPLQDLIDQTRERFKNRPLTPEERRMYYLE